MPYKDKEVRRVKAREYTAQYRERKKVALSLQPKTPRYCMECGVCIIHKKANAMFCSRAHKGKYNSKKRDHKSEYARNRAHKQAKALQYYHSDITKSRTKLLAQQKKRLHLVAAYEAKRRGMKLQRTPLWVTQEDEWLVQEVYLLAKLRTATTGFSWHVDHIIPLNGVLVSGLHVINNLQVIPGAVNISKSNTYNIE